ncbi:MAG: tetraacyldisaccharide 4'-kinase [Sulfurospirillum sp.]|nr:tetraacyldisaccharide 4'-kinase [Sulfurospirillum sp.]
MYNRFVLWVEEYLFFPSSPLQYLLAFLLLPFSLIYTLIVTCKRFFARAKPYGIPIISVGNLSIGGSGKTPFLIALAARYENCAVVLRGYKRKSKGMIVVSHGGKILVGVQTSGDEAALLAKNLSNATIIVAEDRIEAILRAKELGCKIVFLDDGFSKANIQKFDILIQPKLQPKLPFCLPSGAYREPPWIQNVADLIIKEDIDFHRVVQIQNPSKKMVLVTAISKPQRLDPFLNQSIIAKEYFADHHHFSEKELIEILQKYKATSLLVTQKDLVKIEQFVHIPVSILALHVEINKDILTKINAFLDNFR